MFSKKKHTSSIDAEQREQFEHAQQRIRQKKNLFRHFIIFLAGSIVLIVLNVGLGFGQDFKVLDTDWFVFAIIGWAFLFIVHVLNVFLLNTFMGKEWEARQLEKLVAKQRKKIAQMEQKVANDFAAPIQSVPTTPITPTTSITESSSGDSQTLL